MRMLVMREYEQDGQGVPARQGGQDGAFLGVDEGVDEGAAVLLGAMKVAAAVSLRPPVLTGSRASSGGHYMAHHIEVEVADAATLRELYSALKAVPGVRLVL